MDGETTLQQSFGELLKTYRKRKKMTQRQFAAKLDIHYNTVWAWERGDHLPDTRGMVLEIAQQLDLNDFETRHLLEASLTALSGYWHVPYQRNRLFTGRNDVLMHLHAILCQSKAAALTQSLALSGLGGIGKTQTALEYAYRHAQEYTAIFWIAAETHERIMASFSSIASSLNCSEQHELDRSKMVFAVLKWLANHRDWLLIIDNVEDIALVKQFLPTTRDGSLLFTTRMQAFGALAHPLAMERMKVDEGARLLLYRALHIAPEEGIATVSPHEIQAARAVVEALDGLPLAIDQAGAYIEETGCLIADYLQLYHTAAPFLLNERGTYADHPLSVAKTFALTFEKVQQRNSAAAELLRVCAFLAPDAIPEELITQGASWLGPTMYGLVAEPLRYHAAIKELLNYSLIRRNAETKLLTIHRLVQAVLKDIMPVEEQKAWLRHIIQALDQLFPAERLTNLSQQQWTWCGQLLPHALVCATLSMQWEDQFPEAPSLFLKAANHLRDRASYAEAEPLYLRSLALYEKLMGKTHYTTAIVLNHLGVLYEYQARSAEAEPLYLRALSIYEQELGANHPDTAQGLNTLAAFYHYQGQYEKAEPLYLRALSICEHVLGSAHLDTVQNLNNLAVLYGVQGKYVEAEPLFRRALAIREQKLGLSHPSTAASLNNLATLYRKQGKYSEAEPLYQQALHICEQELGSTHPHTANSLNNLALLYRAQGRNAEAEPLLQRALAIREQELGLSHPDTAQSLNDIASLYLDQGREAEAEPLLRQALTIVQQTLSMEHPLAHTILQSLADPRINR